METHTFYRPSAPPEPPERPPAEPARPPRAQGFRPTPDPTRSGALWVGGAGVALLLAAAGVLTAVRWDDIGQSAKLGGLVAITLALLAGGRRLQPVIPMTAQAIFHLGALLVPFDMAAVAILAGQSWQQTLLLTSVTSVAAWYGIGRAVPSPILLWCARAGVVASAAGVAAVSPAAMPLMLAVAGLVAIAARRSTAAATWALAAGVLPLGSLVSWPARIAGGMEDLGFADPDRWQPLLAGVLSILTLAVMARLTPRLETAWSAVAVGVITTIVALSSFSDARVSYITLGALFVAIELLALATNKDVLWKSVSSGVADVGEVIALAMTAVLFASGVLLDSLDIGDPALSVGTSAALFALGWLTADRRRLDGSTDWLSGLLVGANWPVTTVMFPVAVLAVVISSGAPAFVGSLVATALAFWMVSTWRLGAAYGAVLLSGVALAFADSTDVWIEAGLGALSVLVLVMAARFRIRARDALASIFAATSAVVIWLVATQSTVEQGPAGWTSLLVLIGAWAIGLLIEAGDKRWTLRAEAWVGRGTALLVLVANLWTADPAPALAMCLAVVALSALDFALAQRRGASIGSGALTTYALIVGAAVGLAGVPVTTLAGLSTTAAGVALAVAAIVAVGVALAVPESFGLPLAAVATVCSTLGLAMASGDPGAFAVAIIAVGTAASLLAGALRDKVIGTAGFITVGVGISLQLAVWQVEWIEPYLVFPAIAALVIGYRHHRAGGSSWAAYTPTIGVLSYVAIIDRLSGGSAWHAVIAGAIGVLAVIAGGYRRLAGPLVTGSVVLAIVVGYESLGPAALVPTWAWLAIGGSILLGAGVAMERSDTTPLERGQQLREVVSTQFS